MFGRNALLPIYVQQVPTYQASYLMYVASYTAVTWYKTTANLMYLRHPPSNGYPAPPERDSSKVIAAPAATNAGSASQKEFEKLFEAYAAKNPANGEPNHNCRMKVSYDIVNNEFCDGLSGAYCVCVISAPLVFAAFEAAAACRDTRGRASYDPHFADQTIQCQLCTTAVPRSRYAWHPVLRRALPVSVAKKPRRIN